LTEEMLYRIKRQELAKPPTLLKNEVHTKFN
jgi:hypothetical protein